jgi:predicted RND superfamily exporter protein
MDYELMQLLYGAYATEHSQYGEILAGLSEYRVPLIDMFMFLKAQLETNNISIPGQSQQMMDELFAALDTAMAQLQSENYSRMVVYLDLPEEGDRTFAFLDQMHLMLGQYYPGDFYVIGNSPSCQDLASTFSQDNLAITLFSVFFVIMVLLLTFQSVGLPLLLIMTIQGSIWMNFAVPAILDTPLFFLGYLVVQAIQMGANIDYAIVISSHYQELKQHMPHKQAIIQAVSAAFPTVLTSGGIMVAASFLIGGISTNAVIGVMGSCLGRGTLISIFLVLFVLPPTLVLGDSIIDRTRFRVKIPQLDRRSVTGAVRVKGRVRGYISGVVDADFDGILRGQLDANVSNATAFTEITEDDAAQKGGQAK